MKPSALLLAASLAVVPAFAQDAKPADGAAPVAKRSLLKYTPPKGTGTGARIDGDGGSLGPDVVLPKVSVLAPKEAGITINPQPSLYWFQAGPMPEKVLKTAKVEVTLIDPKSPKPLFKVASALSADKAAGAGLRRVSVAKQNVTLKPGVTYKWTVALVPDPTNRSQDVVTSATIQCIEPSKELAEALKTATPEDKAGLYAQNGVWYDALEAISTDITKNPTDGDLRKLRGGLLEQGGLKDAAAADLK